MPFLTCPSCLATKPVYHNPFTHNLDIVCLDCNFTTTFNRKLILIKCIYQYDSLTAIIVPDLNLTALTFFNQFGWVKQIDLPALQPNTSNFIFNKINTYLAFL